MAISKEAAWKMRRQLESLAQTADEKMLSKCITIAPHWSQLIGKTVGKNFRFQHRGVLYATNQPNHTFVAHYEPGPGMESLYREIPEWFAGTEEDPIPYSGNMALEKGKIYTENGIMYQCIRDSLIPVFEPLSELQKIAKGGFVIAIAR